MTNAQLMTALAKLLNANVPAKRKTKKQAKPAKPTGDEFIAALMEACAKLGFADAKPRENVLTYDRWLELGRKVRKGEKSIVVAGRKSGLFHISQTDVTG